MDIYTPTKQYLERCTLKEISRIALLSGVPESTLYKIRSGDTGNPGVLTVQKIYPHIEPDGKNRRKLVYGRRESDNGRRRKVIKPE
jgi:predicted transcriptional regulator